MELSEFKKFSSLFSEYTELRIQENRNVSIAIVKGNIVRNSRTALSGVSARVYKDGFWGFASNPEINSAVIRSVIKDATANAIFLATKNSRQVKSLPTTSGGRIEKDFSTSKPRITQKEIIEFLRDLDDRLVRTFKNISTRTLSLNCLDMEKKLLTSSGSLAYTVIPRSILYVVLTTLKDGKPIELYDTYGGFGQIEEHFQDLEDLMARIGTQYEHLQKKAEGIHPDAGLKDCILDADLAGILSHEAIGHTVEADIVLGGSIAADYLDTEVASPLVSMTDFASSALGRQCPVPVFVDDEGTPAQDTVLIEHGILKSFMHNKETAAHFGVAPTGNARAYGFDDEPLIRMRNTAILPGPDKLDDMISSIDDGYYLLKSSNGQADSTSEFMFGIVMGYEIKKGSIGRAILDTTISGVAFDMLQTITMISDEMSWTCSGMCGKKQSIPVGMGGPAVKCKINIGGK
ncbi:MAG: TldD/PmbA family protein [Candidatus Cloacimonetes bacterium]|nr:TldD/PmbA family protein [Candidatus Cloacimonadota bacterium]